MSLQNIFTANGLIQAIKDHHKNLHENYSFPPLKGMKPVHKFAESLGFGNAEQLQANLSKIQPSSANHAVHVNLCDSMFTEQFVCYFEPEDCTLRIQIYNDADFVIVTVNNDFAAIQPNCHYIDSKTILITYDYVQVLMQLDKHTAEVRIIEDVNKDKLNNFEFCIKSANTSEVDYQFIDINFDMEKYSEEIFNYITTIDNNQRNEISSEYIECAKDDELNSMQAANDWFDEDSVRYKLVNTRNGYKDYDVIGHHTLRRIKVPHTVKHNDVINMYHGKSTKTGLIWKGDIISSIQNASSLLK
jgi:hypothetical protein